MSKSEFRLIQNQIKEDYKLVFPKGGILILGVSGGPDSMALLYLFYKSKIPVFVVHINYKMRGLESDADQKFVEDMAFMWGFECCTIRLEKEKLTGNFQDWARNERYQIFRALKKEHNARGIAVAHHSDDQIETILSKLLRGGGFTSWKGLQLWNGEIFRPLLHYSKNEIIKFCDNESIPYRQDSSNESNKYARNALRNVVFPIFEKFFPGWMINLEQVGKKAEISNEILNFILDKIVENESIETVEMEKFSLELKASLLKEFIFTATGYICTKGHLSEAVKLIESQTGKILPLTDKFSLVKGRGKLSIKRNEITYHSLAIQESELNQKISHGGWELAIKSNEPNSNLTISIANIRWPIFIRKWKSGDKFQPFGMRGSQKISDHLTNRKINPANRGETLILTDSGGTICAVLYPETASNGEDGCISELLKVTQTNEKILSISKIKL